MHLSVTQHLEGLGNLVPIFIKCPASRLVHLDATPAELALPCMVLLGCLVPSVLTSWTVSLTFSTATQVVIHRR